MSLHSDTNDNDFPFLFMFYLPWQVWLILLVLLAFGSCMGSCMDESARPTWDKHAKMGAEIWLRKTYDGAPFKIISTRVESGSIYHMNASVGKGENITVVSFDCDGKVIARCEVCQ